MADRDPYRKMISTRSAGKGRIITLYWSPLNLRHELDFRGKTMQVFRGSRTYSLTLARAEADRLCIEIRDGDTAKLTLR